MSHAAPSRHAAVGPATPHRRDPRRPTAALAGVVLCLTGFAIGFGDPGQVALAQVAHGQGYEATVLGWTSWYGSYELGSVGTGWCIDHGLQAPDAAFGYVPTDVGDAPVAVRAAIAWTAARPLEGPIDHAARMLAFHDLMGAQYPFGRIDVDALQPHQLAGFGGAEGDVLARARLLKADGLAHSHLRGPVTMVVDMNEPRPGADGEIGVRLTDAGGQPLGGLVVEVTLTGGERHGPGTAVVAPDGWARVGFTAGSGEVRAAATAVVPSLTLSAWASSTVAAQRIVRPDTARLEAADSYLAIPPTTTVAPTTTTVPSTTTAPSTTVPPTTTTTAPATTTTTVRATTTTAPSTTTTTAPITTTAPPATTTSVPPATSPPTSIAPPASLPRPLSPSAPVRPTLPRTGPRNIAGMTMVATGLVLTGAALVGEARRRRPT